MSPVRRRQFLLFAGALPIARLVRAQQQKLWRVGYLAAQRRDDTADFLYIQPFLQEMRELGYIEGKNVQYEWRFADGRYERLPSLAAELVRLKVDVILALTTPSARAAQQATTAIPIVITSVANPLETGLVASMAHPGANITGVTNFLGDISQKQLELLVATVPKLSLVAVLINPSNESTEAMYKSAQAVSQKLGVRLLRVEARTPEEIESAFSTMGRERAQALLQIPDGFFNQQHVQIVRLAEKFRIPAMYPIRLYSAVGGLMSYGTNIPEVNRRAAIYVDKILRGAKPAELPVTQPTKFELLINLKTAKALEVTIPQSILARADEVIR
jgi:putative ABC transport system substrate-binding protein